MTCPTCGSDHVEARRKSRGPYPLGIVAIFGLPFAQLHQIPAAREFHCGGCGRDFASRTVRAQIARALLFIFCAAFVLMIALVIIALRSHPSPP